MECLVCALEYQVINTGDQHGNSFSGRLGLHVSCVGACHARLSVERVILCGACVCVTHA